MASVGELLLARAQQEGDAGRRGGAIAGNTWRFLADLASKTGQQIQQERTDAPIRAQEAQLRGLQIQSAQGEVAAKQRTAAEDKAFTDLLHGPTPPTPDQLMAVHPERGARIAEAMSALARDPIKEQDNIQSYLQKVTLGINALPESQKPAAYEDFYSHGVEQKLFPANAAPAKYDPASFQRMVHYAQKLPTPEPYTLKEGETRFDAANRPLASVAAKVPAATAEQDTARATNIRTRLNLKQPVSPEESAWLKSHETEKTLGVDLTAGMAGNRQATAIAAQTAQQQRAQNFQEQQQGRKELTDKVEQPYQTAAASAQTLRDTVAAAKAGNKVAGSLQSLETVMSAIRAQGLNRINTAEIGVAADAGSLWDRIVGRVGKLDAGQPVPPDVQKDMTQFASILEKAAYRKYLAGHASTTKRYGLTDETPISGPTIYARDAQGNLHSAPYGQKLPAGWTEE